MFLNSFNDSFYDLDNFSSHKTMRNNYYFRDAGGEFIFEYEVPGLSKEDIQVSSENNYINIVVNDKRHGEEKYEYSFKIPNFVETRLIKADLSNGLLKINMPKRESIKKQIIDINN